MKKIASILFTIILFYITQAQPVGIGTNSPNASAQLDLESTTKGFLPPRLTKTERDAIQNPVAGLMVWCIDCDELQVYDGYKWKNATGSTSTGTSFSNVRICNQVWMIKNLDITSYRNGESIPHVTDPAVWSNLTTAAWCWYNNDSATYAATYGRLYNWYAVNDPRGLAPAGWHIPTAAEWSALVDCMGGVAIAGGKMKSVNGWDAPNANATNYSGFSGIPGGVCGVNGNFAGVGYNGFWWSSTDAGPSNASGVALVNAAEDLSVFDYLKKNGFSIRCVRD